MILGGVVFLCPLSYIQSDIAHVQVCDARYQGDQSLTNVVTSKAGVPIRLTDERWAHIAEEHCELAGYRLEVLETVANPARVYAGQAEELLAVSEVETGKWLVVVYRELVHDGFVITAFFTRRITSVERRQKIWP